MDQFDEPYYECRDESLPHDCLIKNKSSQAMGEFEQLVKSVFSHQRAAYAAPESPVISSHDASRLATYFYNECFISPDEYDGLVKGIDGIPVSLNSFLETAFLEPSATPGNRLCYLLGDVGVGKTSFLSYIITRFGYELVSRHSRWFVRLDCERTDIELHYHIHELVNALCDKAIQVLRSHPTLFGGDPGIALKLSELSIRVAPPDFKRTEPDVASTQRYAEQSRLLAEIVAEIKQKYGRSLILIVDNLDIVCHKHDRMLFLKGSSQEEEQIRQGVCELAKTFLHGHPAESLARLGAHVLFVMRRNTYNTLRRSGRTSLPQIDDTSVYSLRPANHFMVLDARSKLLTFQASNISEHSRRLAFTSLTEKIRGHLLHQPESQPPLVHHLMKLTNKGLRELMEYFNQYSWLPRDKEHGQPADRFIAQYPVGLMTYLLDGRRRFNQFSSEKPNIYLVRTLPTDDFSTDHEKPHSYWLKRLIVEYLRAKGQQQIAPQAIVHVFSGNNGRGYPEELVRIALGSLTDSNCSNLIQALRRTYGGHQVVSVLLTERGAHCIENIFDRFFYLQLVVDDWMLPIPKVVDGSGRWKLTDVFQYPTNLDYSYIVAPDAEYHERASDMIHLKSRQVLFFLEILDGALEGEKRSYPSAFERLREEGVTIPDMRAIKQALVGELSAISQHIRRKINIEALNAEVQGKSGIIRNFIVNAFIESSSERRATK